MAFSSVTATEALFAEQGITSVHKDSPAGKVLGRQVFYDPGSGAVIFFTGFDHSTYPDQHFLLLINRTALNVWKKFDQARLKSSVLVYLTPEVEHLEDSFFVSLLKPVLCNAMDDEDPVVDISVTGRKVPPAPPRSPEELVAFLNRFGKLSTKEVRGFVPDMFVPALVRPHELEAFVKYIDRAGFGQFKPPMRSIVEKLLPSLRDRLPPPAQ